ncbi:MAG: NUDIX domain-containing protein [Caldilineaceae bacterium SB0665_bin_25]|nr:NUDIX domain-containing protein [Caldilineaceae bacterium SB0665_bin_25]
MRSAEGPPHETFPVTVSREYPPAPLVAVAAVVVDGDGRILMVERGRPPSQGMWALPGGLLDLGEPVRAGVAREVLEETGAEIEIVDLVDLFEPIHRDATGRIRYHYVVIDFWAHYRGGDVAAADDVDDVAWVSVTKLEDLPMEEETRQVVRKAHARWRQASGELNTPPS